MEEGRKCLVHFTNHQPCLEAATDSTRYSIFLLQPSQLSIICPNEWNGQIWNNFGFSNVFCNSLVAIFFLALFNFYQHICRSETCWLEVEADSCDLFILHTVENGDFLILQLFCFRGSAQLHDIDPAPTLDLSTLICFSFILESRDSGLP